MSPADYYLSARIDAVEQASAERRRDRAANLRAERLAIAAVALSLVAIAVSLVQLFVNFGG